MKGDTPSVKFNLIQLPLSCSLHHKRLYKRTRAEIVQKSLITFPLLLINFFHFRPIKITILRLLDCKISPLYLELMKGIILSKEIHECNTFCTSHSNIFNAH